MSVIATATQHVVAKLKASPEVQALIPRVEQGVAAENPIFPFVLVQTYGDSTEVYFNEGRALSEVSLSVRVVMPSQSLSKLVPLYKAVHKALELSSGVYEDDGEISSVAECSRSNETDLAESVNGKTIRYLGGIYDLVIS